MSPKTGAARARPAIVALQGPSPKPKAFSIVAEQIWGDGWVLGNGRDKGCIEGGFWEGALKGIQICVRSRGGRLNTSSGFMVFKKGFGRQYPSRKEVQIDSEICLWRGRSRFEEKFCQEASKAFRGVSTMQSRLWLDGKQELGPKF